MWSWMRVKKLRDLVGCECETWEQRNDMTDSVVMWSWMRVKKLRDLVGCECETGTEESFDRFGSQVVLDEGEEVERSGGM